MGVCVCITGAGVWEEKAVLKGVGVGEGMWLQNPVQGAWDSGSSLTGETRGFCVEVTLKVVTAP